MTATAITTARNSKMTHPLMLFVVSVLLWLGCCCRLSQAHPYMILTSTRSKCFSIIAPQGQTITIAYDAPDMKLPDFEDEEPQQDDKKEEEAAAAAAANGEDGLDSQWNKRMKERLEQMKSKKMKDMSLTVTQKSGLSSGALASRQRKTYNKDDAATVGTGRVREELVERSGTIRFLTGEEDGTVEICVQSLLASVKNPSRFSVEVKMAAADEEDEGDGERRTQEKNKDSLDSSQVSSNMSRLERDLQTLQNRVRACLNNADFNKDQEASFHEQSVSMNNAAKYWPMIHLIVILVTGFTQANHIVTYLKRHHIGI